MRVREVDPEPGSSAPPDGTQDRRTAVDIVVPVHDEERDLEPAVRRLHRYVSTRLPFTCTVTIADNASSDRTPLVAQALADELPGVRFVSLPEKGRGRALRQAWGSSDSAVLVYMDVDLSTDLDALLPLVAPLLSGHSDVAIGTRLSRSARVARGPRRELISRAYNLLLHATLATGFSDAQCGFKAIRADAAAALLPLVQDESWFFDTELLVLAERAGLRIHEVPVDWTDDPDSRVDLVRTALDDLKGVARVGWALGSGRIALDAVPTRLRAVPPPAPGTTVQVLRFAGIGVVSTLAYALLYVLLRQGMAAQSANALALLLTAVGNTAANRRVTFEVRGRGRLARHHLQGLLVFTLALALTAGSITLLNRVTTPGHGLELLVLTAANLTATVLRFVLLRSWVFRPSPINVRRTR